MLEYYARDWTNGPLTKWIGPVTEPCPIPTAEYVYRTTFDLTGLVAETARLHGNWWCADGIDHGTSARIRLNGTLIVTNVYFVNPTVPFSFCITNGFVPGTNVLDFVTWNVGGGGNGASTGIRMDISGTAYNPNGPPDLTVRVSEVELCWPAATGKTYQVQYRSDLTTNLWANLGSTIPGTNGFLCVRDAVMAVQRYYRLQIVP